jgi:hypothetical protein
MLDVDREVRSLDLTKQQMAMRPQSDIERAEARDFRVCWGEGLVAA